MLRPGGYAFLRESHFRPVGSRPQATNPTVYRTMQVRSHDHQHDSDGSIHRSTMITSLKSAILIKTIPISMSL